MIAEGGTTQDTAVALVTGRLQEKSPAGRTIKSYGTIHCGLETMRHAWPTLQHKFSVGASEFTDADHILSGTRPRKDLLSKTPVDLLVIDLGSATPTTHQREYPWTEWIRTAQEASRPHIILESWPTAAVSWATGPAAKGRRAVWTDLGYTSLVPTRTSEVIRSAVQSRRRTPHGHFMATYGDPPRSSRVP